MSIYRYGVPFHRVRSSEPSSRPLRVLSSDVSIPWIQNQTWEPESILFSVRKPVRTARSSKFGVASRSRPARDAGLAADNVGTPRAWAMDQVLRSRVKETQQMRVSALIHRLQTFPLFRRQQRSQVLCLAMRRIYRTPTLHVHLCKRRTHVLTLMTLTSFQWQMRKISTIAGCSPIFSLRWGSFLSCSTRLPCSSLPACFAHIPIIYSRRKASLHSFTHCKLATKRCHGQ